MVEADVGMLEGNNEDVFLAGNRLLNYSGFLVEYSTKTSDMINSNKKLIKN